MNSPKVSIIIPVYNAEKYIQTTIDSILGQTFTDWELILVDDCSKDGSLDICKKNANKDTRIKNIHQEKNGGPSIARNIAMNKAEGEYLSFVDSDDTIERDYLEKLVSTADKFSADIVWCNYHEIVDCNTILRTHGLKANNVIPKDDILSFFYDAHRGIGCLWNKLYRRAFVEKYHLRINPDRFHGEDWEFNLGAFKCSPIVVPIEEALYNYIRQNNQSVISSYHKSDFDNLVRTMELLDDLATERNIKYKKVEMMSRTIYQIVTLLVKLSNSAEADKKLEFNRIRSNQFVKKLLDLGEYTTNQLTTKQKFYFLLFRLRLSSLCMLLMKHFK